MIKISIRDVLADLPPSVLKKRIQEIDKRNNVVNVEGFRNYTPEVMNKLDKMFMAREIDSRPSLFSDTSVTWTNAQNQKHRLNNLPAREDEDGYTEYYINGHLDRSNGPARINRKIGFIEWYKGGSCLLILQNDGYIKKLGSQGFEDIDLDTYKQLVNKEFPEAGNKIRFKDWIK